MRSLAQLSLSLALFGVWIPSAFAQGVFRGPYLNDPTPDAITVVWESPSPTTGVVRYGAAAPLTQSVQSSNPARHHEVRLTGLSALVSPGGELRYELEVGGTIYPGRFRTAVQGSAPFSFIVYGDNRSSVEQHRVVIDALLPEAADAAFAVNTGDLVSNGEVEADWDAFFPVAAPFLAQVPLYVAIGNHEVDLARWDVTRRLFVLPTGGTPPSNSESFYHVVYGNVELIIVNVEVDSLYTIGLLAGDQEAWLEQVLQQAPPGVDHRFLFLHQGPYSSKVGRNGNFWLREWLDALKTGGIDVIFSGHDHYAERGFTQNGLYYLVHGGGGAPMYETLGARVTEDHTIVYSETRLGYARVDIDGPRAHVLVKGIGGEVVDEFRYGDAAAPACRLPADCGPAPRYGCTGGAWECVKSACRYACPAGSDSLITCVTDNACEQQIGASCQGTVSCEHPSINPLSWFCQCTPPPDCAIDDDCAGRASPVAGCTGTWACVDSVCEFTSELCMPLTDGGSPAADAALPISDGGLAADALAADATANADASPSPADAQANDAAPASALDARAGEMADGGASTSDASSTDSGTPPGTGCGCRAAAHARASEPTAWAVLLGAAWLALRRRPRRTGLPV